MSCTALLSSFSYAPMACYTRFHTYYKSVTSLFFNYWLLYILAWFVWVAISLSLFTSCNRIRCERWADSIIASLHSGTNYTDSLSAAWTNIYTRRCATLACNTLICCVISYDVFVNADYSRCRNYGTLMCKLS